MVALGVFDPFNVVPHATDLHCNPLLWQGHRALLETLEVGLLGLLVGGCGFQNLLHDALPKVWLAPERFSYDSIRSGQDEAAVLSLCFSLGRLPFFHFRKPPMQNEHANSIYPDPVG